MEYLPPLAQRLLARLAPEFISGRQIVLLGFGDTMKWLYRMVRDAGHTVVLADWRECFAGYDCGDESVAYVGDAPISTDALIVLCADGDLELKDSMKFLMSGPLAAVDAIYERHEINSPIHQQEPFTSIAEKARSRARSMISDDQLFELIQFVANTSSVDGAVVEFGSYGGGSGAILAEALEHFGVRPLWLFDSFCGIPKSRLGLDYRWHGSFANNSFQEVSAAFADLKNVTVVRGNILDTYTSFDGSISLGYIASDTLESGATLLPFIWERLTEGGLVAVCDYGSYPNCVPLTMYVDEFFSSRHDAFVFRSPSMGIFARKQKPV
jgi:hypothetical protein